MVYGGAVATNEHFTSDRRPWASPKLRRTSLEATAYEHGPHEDFCYFPASPVYNGFSDL